MVKLPREGRRGMILETIRLAAAWKRKAGESWLGDFNGMGQYDYLRMDISAFSGDRRDLGKPCSG